MDAFGERGADRAPRRCAARRRTRPSLPGSRSRTCTRCGRAGWGRRCGDGLDGVEPGNAGHGVAEHPAVALSLGDLVLALTPRLCGAEAVHEEAPVAPGHRRVEKPSLPEGRQLPVPVRRLSGARAHQGDRIGRPAALRGGGQYWLNACRASLRAVRVSTGEGTGPSSSRMGTLASSPPLQARTPPSTTGAITRRGARAGTDIRAPRDESESKREETPAPYGREEARRGQKWAGARARPHFCETDERLRERSRTGPHRPSAEHGERHRQPLRPAVEASLDATLLDRKNASWASPFRTTSSPSPRPSA